MSRTRHDAGAAAPGNAKKRQRVAIVGLGNIGSHLVPLVGRNDDVAEVTLVDFDAYETKNVPCQSIDAADLGPKVHVQARRLRRINPAVTVHPICARIEDVPLGLLRADVILAGLDSRAARRQVNRAAWWLGVPWIDAAVDASGLLARVNVYVPGSDSPCLECAWDETDYALLEQEYHCPRQQGTAATNAPAGLGAVAAGMTAVEWRKLADGDAEHLLAGRQALVDLRHHIHDVTSFRRRPGCKFDHQTWSVDRLHEPPSRLALRQLMQRAADGGGGSSTGCALRLEGHRFVRGLFCPECGTQADRPPHLARRIPAARRQCPQCGQAMVARGFDMCDWLEDEVLAARDRRRSLSSLGFRPGDVVTVRGPAGERHWELGGAAAAGSATSATVHSCAEETSDE